MKKIMTSLCLLALVGCTSNPVEPQAKVAVQSCLGTVELPKSLASHFDKTEDPLLLDQTLGQPTKGKLCQGQVYQQKVDSSITVYRAWNSTNPNSQFGHWWAFYQPTGKVATYRADYEICYQWSPLDKLARCTLKSSVKVVVGTGQSAECSAYLTYPVSESQQIFIEDASASLVDCEVLDGEFSWK